LDAYKKEQKEKAESFDDGLCDLHQRPFELCKLTPEGQLYLEPKGFRGHPVFERMLKYFEQGPMSERWECKMQNFISFLTVLIFFEKDQYS